MQTTALQTGAISLTVTLVLVAAGAADAQDPAALPHLNVHYMMAGYFLAGGETHGIGGFAPSDNLPKPLPYTGSSVVYMRAYPGTARAFRGQHRGLEVRIVNGASQSIAYDASDSRLDVVAEAIHPDGGWRPIEYLPQSWCGNSFHTVTLPAKHYWTFIAPSYTGSLPTKIRFRFGNGPGAIYSNSFAASVNPEQFEKKQSHQPAGIMDPYPAVP